MSWRGFWIPFISDLEISSKSLNKLELKWLQPAASRLGEQLQRGLLPHALLIQGATGTGRAHLAQWLAASALGLEALPRDDEGVLQHPDLKWCGPVEDRQTIGVDQVRGLIGFMSLTAHQGGRKVAVIAPAEAMTTAAANSLLKTLEEPPAGSLLILIAAQSGHLPATVRSRCQVCRIPRPDRDQALRWLEGAATEPADWQVAMELAGGAPLHALELAEQGFLKQLDGLAGDLKALVNKQATPLACARRWLAVDEAACAVWLYRETAKTLTAALTGQAGVTTLPLKNSADPLTMDAHFGYLRDVAAFRGLAGSGKNAELALAQLLDYWYGGLGA